MAEDPIQIDRARLDPGGPIQTDADGESHGAGDADGTADRPLPRGVTHSDRIGARPIRWRWWLAAALLSLAIWGGVMALLVT